MTKQKNKRKQRLRELPMIKLRKQRRRRESKLLLMEHAPPVVPLLVKWVRFVFIDTSMTFLIPLQPIIKMP